MKSFTGWEYMLIDVANNYGHDKELFETRIDWANRHMHELEAIAGAADNYPQYCKGVMAIRAAMRGEAIGHTVALDAVCSGIQIMSALTGCITGATATGLVDPDRRADAYGQLQAMMQGELGMAFTVSRGDAKDAMMPMFYGSKKKPVEIFGEGTEELSAYYRQVKELAPGAWEALQTLLASWQSHALVHEWKLPDGFHARIKVMTKVTADDSRSRIEVDELDGATFTYEYKINEATERGVSNAANVIHSIDAWIMRSMHRRCNYDKAMVEEAYGMCRGTLSDRTVFGTQRVCDETDDRITYYMQQYERSGLADVVILPYIDMYSVERLSNQHLQDLIRIMDSMLKHPPFELITVHDEFRCCPNYMNHVRQHYIDIFAEIADSDLLGDILSQIHGFHGQVHKLSGPGELSALIRNSNYSLS
jgi:hypothetical protein